MTNNAISVITPAFRIQTFEATGVFPGVYEIIASTGTITIAGSSDPTSLKAPGKRVRISFAVYRQCEEKRRLQ